MRKTMLCLVVMLAMGTIGWGQAEPSGIIVEPPDPAGLTVRIWTDKPVYAVGEVAQISFEINRDAYIYIWDIMPDGRVQQIFPNQYEQENYFRAGQHTIPSPGRGYSLRVEPPLGTEWLQILAVTRPIPQVFGQFSADAPFPILGSDPEQWRVQLEVRIQGLVPEPTQRAYDFTSFQIAAAVPQRPGTLRVNTNPALARLYVDGMFRGWTPRELDLLPGSYQILLQKDGYEDYTTQMTIFAGRTRTLSVDLRPVQVNQPPVAVYDYNPPDPRPGEWVRFDAAGSYDPDGSVVRYEWDFNDDGRVDSTRDADFYRFSRAGRYIVRLTVTDDEGATDETTQTVTVGEPNEPPVARFTADPEQPQTGQWVEFDASESFDPDGSIVRYQWDIGDDGTVDGDRSDPLHFHRFSASGTYTVRLIVTDDEGATGETTRTVRVGAVNRPPVARFTFAPEQPLVGMAVTFDASDSYDPDGYIASYRWDLNGDGSIDRSGREVSWTYTSEGAYSVTLQVTDDGGTTSQETRTVNVMRFISPLPPGKPDMGATPGIFVWGVDSWNITVNGSPLWGSARPYYIELRTDGRFVGVSTEEGAAPAGLLPEPVDEGWRLVFEGSVRTGSVTYTFQVRDASSIWMDLRLDTNGDGTPNRVEGLVRFRRSMVASPYNPVVVGLHRNDPGPLTPSVNFQIGFALAEYTERQQIIMYRTTIDALE